MLGTNVGFVWPPHIQQWPTMPNIVGICWDQCWHRLARALVYSRVHTTQTSPGSAQVFENLGMAHASVDAKNLGSA